MTLVPLRKAVELTGLSQNTLRKYADNGTIKCERTPSGYRLFDADGLAIDSQGVKYLQFSAHAVQRLE
jgi:DNA-binding transcriptional MerR regulator